MNRDIEDKLEELVKLKAGDQMPEWLYDETGTWANGLESVFREALKEIKKLRAILA